MTVHQEHNLCHAGLARPELRPRTPGNHAPNPGYILQSTLGKEQFHQCKAACRERMKQQERMKQHEEESRSAREKSEVRPSGIHLLFQSPGFQLCTHVYLTAKVIEQDQQKGRGNILSQIAES